VRLQGEVSQKMLTVTVRTLEADDLVKRTFYPEIPPRVEYQLTVRGKSLMPHIHGLVKWAHGNLPAIQRSRRKHELEDARDTSVKK
jgi:DNA-binding HxlR family transcriptional regulator